MENAQVADGASFDDIEQRLRATFAALDEVALLIGSHTDVEHSLSDGRVIRPGLNLLNDARNIGVRLDELRKGIFTVLVIGTFKNGKSTLLNALMGSSTLPMRSIPCTAVISVLVHGQAGNVRVVQNTEPPALIMPWKEFDEKYRLSKEDQQRMEEGEVLDRFGHVEYAEIPQPHHLLATGVRLVDSPGLGEHILRTRAAMNFLSQAHAVVVVLNAIQLLSQDERFFIKNFLGRDRLNHVFFVINKINLVESPEEVKEIKDWVHGALSPHFLDEHGEFDETFYHKRVFFVNARAALDARTSLGTPEQLEASGMLAFERELEHFLTSDEKFAAALQSTSQALRATLAKVDARVERSAAALRSPLELLRAQQARVEAQLKSVEREKRIIERTVDSTAEKLKNRIYDDLVTYFRELEGSWAEDAQELDWKQTLSIGAILGGIFNSKRLEATIRQEITKYLTAKMRRWSTERLPVLIRPEMQALESEVQQLLTGYSIRLQHLSEAFARPDLITNLDPGTDKNQLARGVQATIGILMLDPSQVTGAALGTGDWSQFIARAVLDGVIYGLLFWLFGPFGIVAYLIFELGHMLHQRDRLRERIVESVGKNLFAGLQKAMPEQKQTIFAEVDAQFKQISDALTESVQQQIDDVRSEMADVISEKLRKDSDAKSEIDRQFAIRDQVLARYNEIRAQMRQPAETIEQLRAPVASERADEETVDQA